ncbi:hypothetical protein DFH06DRAFT_928501, partial [Mycena polygramma]
CGHCRAVFESSGRLLACDVCGEAFCLSCCVMDHRSQPLHTLREWTGRFWQATALHEIGLIYQLGHNGDLCPTPAPGIHSIQVLDTTGVHRVRYRYCGCDRSRRTNNLGQLLRCGWYPASITDPSTCATFKVLDLFRLLNVVANVNANDFITTLERRTDAMG